MTDLIKSKAIVRAYVVISVILSLLFVSKVHAATFTINSLGDESDIDLGNAQCMTAGENCTLRAAIEESNALSGPDTINFDATVFPTSAIKTIDVPSSLPTINSQIDIIATTSNCSATNLVSTDHSATNSPSSPHVRLNSTGSNLTGLSLITLAANSKIQGFIFSKFYHAIIIQSTLDATISCNYFGTDGKNTEQSSNAIIGSGLELVNAKNTIIRSNLFANASNGIRMGDYSDGIIIDGNIIGTDETGQFAQPNSGGIIIKNSSNITVKNNLVSGNAEFGVNINSSSKVTMTDNIIGTKLGQIEKLSNNVGISLNASSNDGGKIAIGSNGHGNTISGNKVGINLSTANNVFILGNYIGTNNSGSTDIGNETGIKVLNSSSNVRVGSVDKNESNNISYNTVDGITITSASSTSKLAVFNNILYKNGRLGINIIGDGVDLLTNANDADDSDQGSNDYLNFPVISDSIANGNNVTLTYSFDPEQSDDYILYFCQNDTAETTCQNPLGSTSATGKVTKSSITFDGGHIMSGKFITAYATRVNIEAPAYSSEISDSIKSVVAAVLSATTDTPNITTEATTAPKVLGASTTATLASTGSTIYTSLAVTASVITASLYVVHKRKLAYQHHSKK